MEWFVLAGAFWRSVGSWKGSVLLPSLPFQAYWLFWLFPHTQQSFGSIFAGMLATVSWMLRGYQLSSLPVVFIFGLGPGCLRHCLSLVVRFREFSSIFFSRGFLSSRIAGLPPLWVSGWGWPDKKPHKLQTMVLAFAIFKNWRNRSKLWGTTGC